MIVLAIVMSSESVAKQNTYDTILLHCTFIWFRRRAFTEYSYVAIARYLAVYGYHMYLAINDVDNLVSGVAIKHIIMDIKVFQQLAIAA